MQGITQRWYQKTSDVAELTLRSVLIAMILTIVLATSNAYLALKLGILTSASIPAAIISMGILRFFKNASILENNAVQTAASAGEAVAGGIVYTIPALIMIGYWHHFDYWTNFFIAASGGFLGVLFSIPLRKVLVHDPQLRFPEGRAIAAVLESSVARVGLRDIVFAGLVGACLECLQSGFKIIAASWSHFFWIKRTAFVFGAGFSATLIGAGYLIGFDMAMSIGFGALLAWGIALPVASHFFADYFVQEQSLSVALSLWNNELCYLGIGAMLWSGLWTLLILLKPLLKNIVGSRQNARQNATPGLFSRAKTALLSAQSPVVIDRKEQDLPRGWIMAGIGLMTCVLLGLFSHVFPWSPLGLQPMQVILLLIGAILYVLIFGALFSVITAYFSGMVGVSASPGSSVVIAGILFASWALLTCLTAWLPLPLTVDQRAAAQAMVIIMASVVTGIAAIANDNTQDLKVGHLIGATPWKQQIMLLFGVLVSSCVIPPVMQVLFNVYGIAGVMPHPGMDLSQSLPAPTAAMLAALTEAVFHQALPWVMMCSGALIIVVILIAIRVLRLHRKIQLSILGIAIGLYLNLSTSIPLVLGGLIAAFVQNRLRKQGLNAHQSMQAGHVGMRMACGLVAGSALMDVVLALIFSLAHRADALSLVSAQWQTMAVVLGCLSTVGLGFWFMQRSSRGVK